ncbi:MAG: sodium:proline symporter [Gammaproteobacteria bacterium SG8_11]|nr:MAG: sodium:proline symporter [Gammaproteobacteria bacterium SG8_11]
MDYRLPVILGLFSAACLLLSPLAKSGKSFFQGHAADGRAPGLLTLTFSQVTTWIFARSLMNAAILGFYYGIWGTLAYAAYYLSFLTGARIVDHIRFKHNYDSIQSFLYDRFGTVGSQTYNLVIGIRLISEVFANLLVIGVLFGVAGSTAYVWAIIAFALVALVYSAIGGLQASLRTDFFQMVLFLLTLAVLMVFVIVNPALNLTDLGFKPFELNDPGPILIMVALLQIWSYPMHDPVMMDRGFIADRDTTWRSFHHAAWLSALCIILFGSLGVFAGAHALAEESMNAVLTRFLGEGPMLLFSIALIVSAMSTLDSTLSSSAKLIAVDMKVLQPTLANGRWVMLAFMLLGLLMVFFGNKDLFSAVAVSGTASMYLAPVIFFCVWGNNKSIPLWSYMAAFLLSITGAVLYFTESSGYTTWFNMAFGLEHKYSKLLLISVIVLLGGVLAFWLGSLFKSRAKAVAEAAV